MKTLILGGVRSGKSALGVRQASAGGGEVVFVATATAGDEEMQRRIERHRRERPAGWALVEEPVHLAAALRAHDATGRCLLVDCLTLWLNNLLDANHEAILSREVDALVETLPRLSADVIMIANETGLGVIPANALARRFCDEAGRLNQRLAAHCDRVTFVAAGLPMALKGPAHD